MSNTDDLGPDPTSQALVRLIPRLGPVVATWRQETYERRQRRAEQLGEVAAEDIGPEQLLEQIAGDERLTDMFNAAVEAAIATSSQAKIRLLGRALAAGAAARDQAKIDEVEQLLRIGLDLDPVDLRAIRALERWRVRDAEATVAHALGITDAIAGAIVARLERLHLVQVERTASILDKKDPDDDQVDLEEEWTVTGTTRALLELLRERQAQDRDPDAVRPPGAPWAGFSDQQAAALERLVSVHRPGWPDWGQGQETTRCLTRLDALGVPLEEVLRAMRTVGISEQGLMKLSRGEEPAE